MTDETEWNDIDTGGGPAVTTLANEALYQLIKYVYVVSCERFVLVTNPSMEKRRSKTQFNDENYGMRQYINNQNPSDYIIRHCADTNVVNHIDMHPSHDLIYLDEDGDKILNIFPPNIPIPDIELPDPKPFLDHVLHIYNGNQDQADHVLRWMAHVLFKPEHRMRHGIVTSGDKGTGKSMIADVMEALLHERGYSKVKPDIFTDRFQDWIEGIRLAVIEEVELFGQGRKLNQVKEYFTGNRFTINPKGKPVYKINNFCNYMLFSNYINPIPLEPNDRRYWYVHSRPKQGDKPQSYFDFLFDEFLDPFAQKETPKLGCFAVAKYLRDVVLPQIPENFATNPPPLTRDKISAIGSSKTPLQDYIEEQLESGLGLYAPQQIFRWKALKQDVKDCLGLTLGNNEAASIVLGMGIKRERHRIKGKVEDVCWFETDREFDDEITKLFNDTSDQGRKKLMSYFYDGEIRF